MTQIDRLPSCFVIAPIGPADSPTRLRSDTLYRDLISPVSKECGFGLVVRADQIDKGGLITSQIVEHLVGDDLVIADLTDHNPNVFYELAVRHASRKPVIHLIHDGQTLPFDLANQRTIAYDTTQWGSLVRAREDLKGHIDSVLTGEAGSLDNPITVALDLQALRGSEDDLPRQVAVLRAEVQDLRLVQRTERAGGVFGNERYRQVLKADLRNLITAQESYFADHTTYADDVSLLDYQSSPGVEVEIMGRSHVGWSATAFHSAYRWRYAITLGDGGGFFPSDTPEGEPFRLRS